MYTIFVGLVLIQKKKKAITSIKYKTNKGIRKLLMCQHCLLAHMPLYVLSSRAAHLGLTPCGKCGRALAEVMLYIVSCIASSIQLHLSDFRSCFTGRRCLGRASRRRCRGDYRRCGSSPSGLDCHESARAGPGCMMNRTCTTQSLK